MSSLTKRITVYEYQKIAVNEADNEVNHNRFTQEHFDLLQKHSEQFKHVYDVWHKKICFKSFVGVLQLGGFTFEILPKLDFNKNTNQFEEPYHWRNVLIDMLRYTNNIALTPSDFGNLRHKHNSILELYFEFFLKEVDRLLHKGLIKKYRPKEENIFALKGKLQFSKHISKNVVHQERFYVQHTTYDTEHTIHQILYKTIKVIKQFNMSGNVRAFTYRLLLNLPEFKDINVIPATFEKLQLNRKSQDYKKALNLAKMILLHYHPDTQTGKEEVLALLFDMNKLWERFVLKSIQHNCDGVSVSGQVIKTFIASNSEKQGFNVSNKNMKPDIHIKHKNGTSLVLDTKWKHITKSSDISDGDYRQLFTYLKYFDCQKVAFLYPSNIFEDTVPIKFEDYTFRKNEITDLKLDGIFLKIENVSIKEWSKNIGNIVKHWIAQL